MIYMPTHSSSDLGLMEAWRMEIVRQDAEDH
jgi:hypothetical protein